MQAGLQTHVMQRILVQTSNDSYSCVVMKHHQRLIAGSQPRFSVDLDNSLFPPAAGYHQNQMAGAQPRAMLTTCTQGLRKGEHDRCLIQSCMRFAVGEDVFCPRYPRPLKVSFCARVKENCSRCCFKERFTRFCWGESYSWPWHPHCIPVFQKKNLGR